MTPPDLQLPDDIETLKAMVLAMAEKAARTDALESEVADLKARNADADERIERLTQILKAFDRARFGRRSEKLGSAGIDDEQQAFVFEEIETGIAAIRAQVNKGAAHTEKRPPRPRKGFAPHLERVEVVIEPDELPEHVGKQKVLIGEDVSERLDVVPAKFRVIVTADRSMPSKMKTASFRPPHPRTLSRRAFRRKRFSPKSPSRSMPMAFRSIGRRQSMPATRSSLTGS
ncbi:hypothetical protein J2774_003601 [Rhizobium pusense]|nr:hypothetical protein [Agrobacterium pusense]